MHHEEQSDSDVESELDDNTTPYHQLELERRAKVVPTEVSTGSSANISMVTILDEMRDTLDEKTPENQDLSLENQNLTAELAKCKLEIVRLDTQQVKLNLERQVRQEQNLVTQRNERNAKLEQEKVMLKTHLKSKDVSIEFLKSENQKVLTDKKKLEDKYLDEIVCLKSANKVATDLLQKFQMPTHTIPMLSKKPKNASQDLHKDILGRSNPRYGKKAPVINASNAWDTDETLASAEVSMAKMKGKPGHVRPESGFYEKLNALKFVPQQELSREQVYWLPANEIASQASTPATPVTPYVPKSPPPSQVLATLHNIKAVFPQFDAIIKERTTVKPLYVSLPCYEYAKEFALQQVVPFLDYFKKHVQTADDTIVKEVAEFKEIHYALEDEYERCVLENKNLIIEKKNLLIKNDSLIAECLERDICSIVLYSDVAVTPSSNCSCDNLRLECDREHNKVLELEAEISKQKRLITESEKRFAFLEQNYVSLQLKFQNYKQCSDTSSASNAIFEINNRGKLAGLESSMPFLLDLTTEREFKVDAQESSEAVGNSGGILCVWDPSVFRKEHHVVSDNFVALYGSWVSNQAKLLVVSIYAPQSITSKRSLWSYISSLISRWDGHLCLKIDFNVKLDSWRIVWEFSVQCARHLSDHRPILLREVVTDYGPSPFRVYHSWFSLQGFDQMVLETWNNIDLDDKNKMVRFKKKLQILKKEIRSWVNDCKKNQSGRLVDLRSKLCHIDKVIDQGGVNDDILLTRYYSTILRFFSLFVRLSINLKKSHLLGVGIRSEDVNAAALYFGCSTMKTPFKYLGVMVGGNSSTLQAWDDTIGRSFSNGFGDQINGIIIVGVVLFMSLPCSSLYKLSSFRYSTWKSIIREVHMLKDRGVDLISHCHIRVGNGLRTQFWNEVWIGDTQLRVMFPRIYALEINKDCTVADKLQFSVTSSLRRSVRGGVESSQLALLQTYIEGTLLSNMEDRWPLLLLDDYNDLSSNDNIKDVDTSSESIDDHSVDDLEYIQTNLNNIVNQVSEQKMDNNEENKQGEEDIHLMVPQQPPKKEANNKESNPECKAESSDLSRPPGFEFMKKSSSPSSKCSTSFARFRKKDIKGVSLIHELNQIIDVRNSLGYDVRGKEENDCGSKIIALNTIMARGRSGGLISMWDPNFFSKESIWCDDSFIIIKENWKNVVGDCYMVNIYGPRDQVWLTSLLEGVVLLGLIKQAKLSKLDRFLISEDVIDLLLDIRIAALDRIWSDHNPILLHVDKIDFGPSPFKLYNSWLLRDGFDDLIKAEWDSLNSNNFGFPIKCHEKFRILKAKIWQWNNNNKTIERNKKAAALEELSFIEKKIDEGSASPSDTENRPNLLHELEIIDKFPSMDLIQKARAKWDIEGDENTKFFHGLINQKRQNQMINANSSFFTLIPKVNNPTLITDFRPISLIGIHYKIIANILANRLSKVIDKIVSKEQSAFIAGPFDSIRWNYLDHILDSLGFGLKWRSWIKTCLSSSKASILVNGLHNAFTDAVGNGLISGININNPSINISHLFFADDVIITTGWNARDLENIIRVLYIFYLALGLNINIHKSNIYGIGVNENEVYNMASNAGCIAGNIPFNYLGLPIGSNMKSIASWKMLIDRFRSRLSTWKASLLSIRGHLTLIKSVLGSLDIYYLSIFRAPESVLNNLERIQSNFFWGVLKLLTLLFSKNSVGGCSLLQMIYGLKSLKLFMVMKVVLIIMAIVSRVHGLTFLDPQTSFTRMDQYWCSKSCFFRDMLNEIGQLNIVASEDTCVWNLGPNGTFTVKEARNIIDQKTFPSLSSTSWDKIIPRKVNIFMWRLSLDRLPHRLNLSLCGMDILAISCSSCNANVESANHIFFECIIASDFWKLVYRWCEIPFVQALSFVTFKD
ncbi:RNA-directed DNA polymerase, eukaryota, reverse transcriptase zinc-binding domain protein [Tanacetum coccineum]